MYKKNLYFLLIVVFFSLNATSQIWKKQKADELFANLSYVEAIPVYESIGKKDADIYRKLAYCYYIIGKYDKAADTFKRFIEDGGYEVEDLYDYAYYLSMAGNYKDAQKWMKKYAEKRPRDSRAARYLKNPDYYYQLLNEQSNVEIKNVSINTNRTDFGPAFYTDSSIVFSSNRGIGQLWSGNREPFLDLYIAHLTNDYDLENPKLFLNVVNDKYHDGPAAFSKDGRYMILTRNIYGQKRIKENRIWLYESYLKDNGKWSVPKPLSFNSPNYSCGHATINSNGTVMFFASDKPGGYGKSDIYVTFKRENGEWSKPRNIGPVVNTEGDEKFPFYDEQGGYLFFSSDGLPGLGGLDIFVVKVGKNFDQFSDPVNLAVPINSQQDDFALIYSNDENGFFSSNRTGGKGDDDIYSYQRLHNFKNKAAFYNIYVKVVDEETGQPVAGVKILVKNKRGKKIAKISTDSQGGFSMNEIRNPEGYTFSMKHKEYLPQTQPVTLSDLSSFDIRKTFYLKPKIPAFCSIKISPLYYDLDKSVIKSDYYMKLDSVVALMKQYPSMRISISSHTDSRATDEYNMELSKKRAYAVIDYLKEHGIDPSRVEPHWYGETRLVNECKDGVPCPDSKHRLNRRTEFEIICPKKRR